MSDLGQAEVDDVLYVGDGDGGLCHVGRQDDLAVARQGGLEDVVHALQGDPRVQHQDGPLQTVLDAVGPAPLLEAIV